MKRKICAAFDLDGTLVDAYEAIHAALNAALRAFGRPEISLLEAKRAVGGGERNLFARYLPDRNPAEVAEVYRPVQLALLPERARPMPGAVELLAALRERGVFVAAATNRSRFSAGPALDAAGIADFFDAVVTADDVPVPKPAPDILLAVLESAGAPPCDAFFVGDMTVDLQAGRNAGIDTFIVLTGSCVADDFAPGDRSALFPDLGAVGRAIAPLAGPRRARR